MARSAVFVLAILLTLNIGATDRPSVLLQCRTAVAFFDSGGTAPKAATALTDAAWCSGYVSAVMDMNIWLQVNGTASSPCLPENSTPEQGVRVFVRYMDDNPGQMHHPPAMLVTRALQAAFPCTNAPLNP